MIPKQKMQEIAERLLAKTRAKETLWTSSDTDDFGCELRLPKSSIELVPETTVGGLERIRMTVNEETPDVGPIPVGEWSVEETDSDWQLLQELYDLASKKVFHWDAVLADVEGAINSRGLIGSDAE
jgi:hypothetical protein